MGNEGFMVAVARVEGVLVRLGEICDLADRLKRDHVGLVRYSTELALRMLRDQVDAVRVALSFWGVTDLQRALIRLWAPHGNDSSGVTWLQNVGQGQRGQDGVYVDGVNGHSIVDYVAFAHRACRETRRMISQQQELVV